MTPIATPDNNSLRAAIQAVNEHRRQMELRRMALAARRDAASADWDVPVPRSRLAAMEQQVREAAALRGLLDSGPVIAVPFSATPPHTLRDTPLALARAIGHGHDTVLREQPLTRLFLASDVLRLQQALYDGDAATLIASLRRVDGRALRCSVHLAPADPAEPDWRWACIVQLPQVRAAVRSHAAEPSLPPKANQRPALDARPAQSA